MDNQLKDLQKITTMALDSEQMRLRRIHQQDAELLEQIKALDLAQTERLTGLRAAGADTALVAGADRRWAVWIEQEKTALNIRRAELRVRQEVQMQATKQAFGKFEAVQRLLETTTEEMRMLARRPRA